MSFYTDYSMNVFAFLNDNSGAVIAIFTSFYVVGTLLMWLELRKTRLKLDCPNIQVSLKPRLRWGNYFDLEVKNLGNTAVYDMKLEIAPSNIKTMRDFVLSELNLFNETIPVFGIGEVLKTTILDYLYFIKIDQAKQFSVTAAYKTAVNKKYEKQKYTFNMQAYLGMDASSEKTTKDIVSELKEINKSLKAIKKG